MAALVTPLVYTPYRNWYDRRIFWVFGFILCAFAFFRPFGLALDDESYLKILSDLCPRGNCSNGSSIVRDYIWYWLVGFGLQYSPDSLDSALALSSLGVFIKLFVIDSLCRQRLFALLLLVPLSFIQYDITQLRSGFASSWLMLAIYWLVQSKVILGRLTLLSNFLVHSQGIFSPGILIYKLLGLYRWLFPVLLLVLLGLIFTELRPNEKMLSWLGLFQETQTYFSGAQANARFGAKVFALGYLPMIGYGVWLWSSATEKDKQIANIVSPH